MRVVVIGGSGHIGSFLVPRLVRAGHHVLNVSRGSSRPYADADEWRHVEQIAADRQHGDADGTFPRRIADLGADTVIDLVCFTLASAASLVEGLRGNTAHLIHCGTLWRYGPALKVPIREGEGTPPFDEYGIQKEAIAQLLKRETANGGLTTTSLHAGHIVGPGWSPTGPLGNNDPAVWATISAGRPLLVPGSGAELMHHVHADDVAQIFELAVANRDAAAGEDFHAVGPSALSVRGYAEIAAGWFGQDLDLRTVTWEEFRRTTTPEFAENSWGHLHRSHCLSIDKPRTRLGYAPQWEPEDAVLESVRWLIDHDRLDVATPLQV